MTDTFRYPYWWPPHDRSHRGENCRRCALENMWQETYLDCDCLRHVWDRVDIGTPAAPQMAWCCSECLRIQGPSWVGTS